MIEMLKRNLAAKIVALIIAIILWFFVMNEQNPAIDSTFNTSLEVVRSSEEYQVERSADTVKLKVRGARSLFALATESDFKAYVDVDGLTEGKHSVRVQTELPKGFELITVSPETAIVDIDKIITKEQKVELAFSGSPNLGATVGKADLVTKEVSLTGASLDVESVARVVGYVSLAGKESDFKASVPLVALNAEGKEVADVKIAPNSVDVDVMLVKGLYKKYVDIKPVVANDLLPQYELEKIQLEPGKIDIIGDQRIVDTLEAIETETISLADVNRSVVMQVKLKLPIGITVTDDVITAKIMIRDR